jgi:indole-3-glycerol phosphate synthase
MSILDEIFAHKRIEVAAAKQHVPEAELEKKAGVTPVPPDFVRALTDLNRAAPRLIAEIKYRSPSKGVLCRDFDPLRLAQTYAENGAAAISVLTDEKYFGGKLEYLSGIARSLRSDDFCRWIGTTEVVTTIPLLRKDFIFDRYQLLEARAAGASAVLLIAAMLEQDALCALIAEAETLSLTLLIEVHTRAELDRAQEAGARVIGINNRDLHTFKVSLQTTLDLRSHIPSWVVVVAESGIKTMEDVCMLADAGVDAMLIGEGLVTAEDVAGKTREFSRFQTFEALKRQASEVYASL